jgi:alpha-tubulin suppressor-like RCC1 family protein
MMMRGSRGPVVLFFSMLLLGACLFRMVPAHAFSPAIQQGLAWLDAQSGTGGALVTDVQFPRQRQSEVLTTYHQLGQSLPGALSHLALDAKPTATDLLARKIAAMRQTGASPLTELEALLALQNRDGGFGAIAGYPSNVLDTSVALEALAEVSPRSDAASKALGWLAAQQNADGHWDRTNVTPQYTDIVITAIAAHAVWRYRSHFVVTEPLEKGRQWLLGQKNGSGHWGNTLQTAHALLSILPGLLDAGSEQAAIDTLTAAQLSNGSWGDDAYLTAIALRVLFLAGQETTNPDLASVAGTVVDANTGNPIAGASVALDRANLNAMTDAQGKFRFTRLQAGAEHLNITAADYRALSSALNLQAGQQLDLGELHLVPGGGTDAVVTGTARYWSDANGERPASNALIEVGSLQTRTDGDGNFTLAGIPGGQYTLKATYGNYPVVMADFAAQVGETVSLSILFKPNSAVTNKKITFVVTNAATGLPLQNATIRTGSTTSAPVSVNTDVAGKATVNAHLADGVNYVEVFRNGYDVVLVTLNLSGWVDIQVPVVLKRVNQAGTFLKGTVVDAQTQQPLAGVVVSVPSKGLETQTDAQGGYRFVGTVLSNESVSFEKPGYEPFSVSLNVYSGWTTAFDVALKPVTNAQNPASLKVTIWDRSTAQPLAGADVILSGRNVLTAQTGADGVVTVVPLTEGDTQIQINAPGYESAYATFKVVAGQAYELPVELLPQSTPTLSLYGVVYDTVSRQPLRGATVSVSGGYAATGVTDALGRYEFADVPTGELLLGVQLDQYDTVNLPISFQGTTEVNVSLEPSWTSGETTWAVYGTIVDSQNLEKLSGATILLQEVIVGSNILAEQRGISDAQGDFGFQGLSHKDARLMIEMPGYDTAVVPFINDGASNKFSLGLIKLNRSYDAALPDLMLKNPDRAAFVVDPNTFIGNGTLSITLRNNSNYDAGAFGVTAFVDTNNNLAWDEGVDQVIDSIRFAGLVRQEERVATFIANAVPLPFRDVPVYVMVDNGLEVVETIEGNNVAAVAVSCVSGDGMQDVAVCVDTSGSVGHLYNLEMEGVVKAVENPNIIPHDGSIRFTQGTDVEMYWGPFIPLNQATVVTPATLPQLLQDLKTKWNGTGYSSGPTCAFYMSKYLNTLSPQSTKKTLILVGDGYWEGIPRAQTLLPQTVANGVSRVDVIGIGSINLRELEANAWPQPANSFNGGKVTQALTAGEIAAAMAQALGKVMRTVDLTLGNLRIIDQGANQPVSLAARIGNAGSESVATMVRFYQGAVLLGEVAVPALKTGAYVDVQLDNVVLAGTEPINAIVDEAQTNAECNVGNNQQQIDVAASNRLASLEVFTDRPVYPANADVLFSAAVKNLGKFPAGFELRLVVRDAEGNEVGRFTSVATGTLAADGETLKTQTWNTGRTPVGDYLLVGVLLDATGAEVAADWEGFRIENTGVGEVTADVRVSVDKAVYAPYDRVNIDALARNLSVNARIPGAYVALTVEAGGVTHYAHTQSLGELVAGSLSQFNVFHVLSGAEPGAYVVSGQLFDQDRQQLAAGMTSYRVENSGMGALQNVSGALTLDKVKIHAGEKLLRGDVVWSTGSREIPGLVVRRVIVRESDQENVLALEETLDLATGQTRDWRDVQIDTRNFLAGEYAALLIAESGGEARLLDRRAFTVTEGGTGDLSQGTHITTGAALSEGLVYVWGFRGSSQQGNGKMVVASNAAPARVEGLGEIRSLTGGAYHLLALDVEGNVYGWGQSGYGETGCAPTQGIYVSTPCRMLENAVQIAAGEYFSIALDANGQVWTWGHNLYGQLGNGGSKNSQQPVAVNLNGEKARLIGAAYEGAFAVTEEGHVWAWGDNEAHGLGFTGKNYGVQNIIRTPTHVINLDPYAAQITHIAGGNGWGEALLEDGTVIGWGLHAALGQGTTKTNLASPDPVVVLRNVEKLFARYVGSFALTRDGKLYTWGQTGGSAFKMIYGEFPTERIPQGKVVEIGGGKEHLFYKTEDGKAYGVGYNDLYKLNQNKCCAPNVDWPGAEIRIK